MTIKTLALPSRISRLFIYLLCLLTSLPAGVTFGQDRTGAAANSASVEVSDDVSDDCGSILQDPTAAQNPALPIVFVPGTAGSELRLDNPKKKYSDDLYWLGLSTLTNNGIEKAQLDKRGNDIDGNEVSAKDALSAFSVPVNGWVKRFFKNHFGYAPSSYDWDVYANFLSWAYPTFGKNRFFYVAPYDWRKGANRESSASIDKVVKRALCTTGQKKVILLAHSLGGLVSRDYIVRTEGKKVAAMIAVGTPWLGTPKAARALVWGYNFDIGMVSEPDGKTKKIKDLPKDFVTDVCKDSKCQSLDRISFLKRETVRELSKNFPGVYLQLPTSDFMDKYGSYYGQDFRSIIWSLDKTGVESLYEKSNSEQYNKAKSWRQDFLNRNDYGVRNYLIGGVYDPACRDKATEELKNTCRVGNRMDMQMPPEEKVPRSSRFRRIVLSVLNALASIVKAGAYDDSFLALDSAYEWGDGTMPLLSATGGEYIRGGKEPCRLGTPESEKDGIKSCYPGAAKKILGEQTEASAVILGSRYAHSAMLDDPKIKDQLLKIYKEENNRLKLYPVTTAGIKDIHSIRIRLTAELNQVDNEMVTRLWMDGKEAFLQPQKTYFLSRPKVEIEFENPHILDSDILAPIERDRKGLLLPARPVHRKLRTTDLHRMSISFRRRNDASRALVITSVEVFINKDEIKAASKDGFTLVRTRDEKQIPFPPIIDPR